jgi:phosphoenolpyruvate synthase/pyruvate phosphate dikinase
MNVQGEDVVAGIRNPMPIATLAQENQAIFDQFNMVVQLLEKHYREMPPLMRMWRKKWGKAGKSVIMVRPETKPDDVTWDAGGQRYSDQSWWGYQSCSGCRPAVRCSLRLWGGVAGY